MSTEALKLLQSVSQSITSSLDLNEVLRRIVEGAVRLLGARLGSLFLLDESKQQLHLSMSHGQSDRYNRRTEIPLQGSFLGQVILQGAPATTEDVQSEACYQQKDLARQEGLHALLAVPLTLGGEAIGVLAVYFHDVRPIAPSEIDLLGALADQSATAVQNARLYERVVRMEEQLHQLDKLSVVGEVAAGLAHEIRNPLAVINMLITSLETDLPETDARRRDIRVIQENVEHIHGLVEELLDLARARPSVPQPIALEPVIESALSLLGPKLSRQQIKVQRRFDKTVPCVRADPGRMQQVLLNLLKNAVEAIGSRGEVTITLDAGPEEGQVALSVHDTGPGIPSEVYQHLFDPFITTKERGVGLGLSIVKRIAEEHEGSVSVRTSSQEGTTFTLLLPTAARTNPGER